MVVFCTMTCNPAFIIVVFGVGGGGGVAVIVFVKNISLFFPYLGMDHYFLGIL